MTLSISEILKVIHCSLLFSFCYVNSILMKQPKNSRKSALLVKYWMAELWNAPLPFNSFTRKALQSLQYTSVLRKRSLKAGTEYSPFTGMQEGWFWHLRLEYRFAPFPETMASIIWFCFSLFSTRNLYSFLFKTWQPVWPQCFILSISKNLLWSQTTYFD